MHVDDLASAVFFVLEKWHPSAKNSPKDENGDPLSYLNVGTGTDITIKKLAQKIADSVKFDGSINWDHSKPDGTPQKLLDISKLKKMGWTASIDIDSGLKRTLEELDNLKF